MYFRRFILLRLNLTCNIPRAHHSVFAITSTTTLAPLVFETSRLLHQVFSFVYLILTAILNFLSFFLLKKRVILVRKFTLLQMCLFKQRFLVKYGPHSLHLKCHPSTHLQTQNSQKNEDSMGPNQIKSPMGLYFTKLMDVSSFASFYTNLHTYCHVVQL